VTTENDKDDKVSARYGELGRAEPPERLDDAILAASRRAVHAAPGRSARRWAVPVSLAAAVVLSVLVSLNVREERPDLEAPSAVVPAPVTEKPVVEAKPEAAPAPAEKKASVRNEARRQPQFAPEPAPAPAPDPAPVPAATTPPSTAGAGAAAGELASQAPARAMARSAPMEMRDAATAKRADDTAEAPERTLERIAKLRAEGSHAEADKLLAEFRQRYPQYRIPDAMLEKVNPPR
jgi:hypothetical protein